MFNQVWFRELPAPILNTKDTSVMKLIQPNLVTANFPEITSKLQPLSLALLYWLFDLCAEVSKHEEKNKMGIKALAIVMAPNLYRVEDNDAVMTAQLQPKVTQFCMIGIQWCIENRTKTLANSTK